MKHKLHYVKWPLACTAAIILFLLLSTCNDQNNYILEVKFYNYTKNAIRATLRDSEGNDFEESYDTVMMSTQNIKLGNSSDYIIEIVESPIRAEFSGDGIFRIKIRKTAIDNYANNTFIYSTELEFIK